MGVWWYVGAVALLFVGIAVFDRVIQALARERELMQQREARRQRELFEAHARQNGQAIHGNPGVAARALDRER